MLQENYGLKKLLGAVSELSWRKRAQCATLDRRDEMSILPRTERYIIPQAVVDGLKETTLCPNKLLTVVCPLSLLNIDRFSKFFHQRTRVDPSRRRYIQQESEKLFLRHSVV